LEKDNSEGAVGPLKKVKGKHKELIKCAYPKCNQSFEKRGPKKYHSPKCQWSHYNEAHPIVRK